MGFAFRLLLFMFLAWSSGASAQPFPAPIEELCQTPEGRQIYLDNLNEWTLSDLRAAVEGMQANGSEVTYAQRLSELVSVTCNDRSESRRPGYSFDFADAQAAFIDNSGGYFQLRNYYCRSQYQGDDGACEQDAPIELPPGYQACRIDYVPRIEYGVASFEPDFFFEGDPHPPRFRGYRLRVWALADSEHDALVSLRNIKLYVVSEGATEAVRRQNGCDFPSPPLRPEVRVPGPSTAGREAPGSPARVSVDLYVNPANRNEANLVLHNSGSQAGPPVYVEVTATRSGYIHLPPSIKLRAVIPVLPGQTVEQRLHQHDAIDWFVSPRGTVH